MNAGVGILVHSRWTRCTKKVHIIRDWILGIDISFGALKTKVVSVYMPHDGFNWQKGLMFITNCRCCLHQFSK